MKRITRKNFLLGTAGLLSGGFLIRNILRNRKEQRNMEKLPVYFVGHGSPMNAIGENDLTKGWAKSVEGVPTPNAILSISAHWFTRGQYVTAMENPKTIHDFYGFPQELFDVQYPAPGDPGLARELSQNPLSEPTQLDHSWGLDHGTWSVLRHMYPKADIPVLQLSIDATKPGIWHYDFAKSLSKLREKGVLILGSGDLVHNLRLYNWKNESLIPEWAMEANETFKSLIQKRDAAKLANYEALGTAAQIAVPTPEHYFPMLYALALAEKDEEISFFNDVIQSSVSLTSFKIG